MNTRIPLILGAALVAGAALTGCASGMSPSAGSAPVAGGMDAATGSTSVGTVIVNGKGHTAYFFEKDMKGEMKSACAGTCATTWPAITATSATPKVSGITGKVSTIPDGSAFQLTINGLPIYTYASDAASGDVKGQGIGGLWWAASPSGSKITSVPMGGGY